MKIFEPDAAYLNPEDYSIFSFIDMIRKGVTFSAFSGFAKRIPFSMQEWASFLHISERTLQRYQQDKRRFDALQSEKIIEIALFYKKGIQVLGTKENLNTWLNTTNLVLGKVQPKALLDSSFGIRLLQDELSRIEHGIFA
jgi:putative toxin-antitoxin system antitoxin component (TIGR02293 family)